MACGLVAELVRGHYGDVAVVAERDEGRLRRNLDVDVAGLVRHVDHATDLFEVDAVAVLPLHQLDHVRLGAGQRGRGVIW